MNKIKNSIAQQDQFYYENVARKSKKLVCGIDEAGRGCLAGPVVAAAAVLFPEKKHPLLRDSKTLSSKQLLEAATWIKNNAWYSICIGSKDDIDSHNILQTTKRTMLQAYCNLVAQTPLLEQKLAFILIDAVNLTLPNTYHQPDLKIDAFPFGESQSISIAAASILAKTFRDKLMLHYEKVFPLYGFKEHKGYGTEEHQKKLKTFGACLAHRPSFLTKLKNNAPTNTKQLSIGSFL